jgi:hypothetical protein
MPQPNIGQPQYGDITKVDKFLRSTRQQFGTNGPEVLIQGPGRPSNGGTPVPSPTPTEQGPPAVPSSHSAILREEALARVNFENWKARAQVQGSGPATQFMLEAAAQRYIQAKRAARSGTPFYEGI